MKSFFKTPLFLIAIITILSCDTQQVEVETIQIPTAEETAQMNKEWIEEENLLINQFVERNEWEMTKSESGLRYLIYEKGEGKEAKSGMSAMVSYSISLLDGKEVFTTKEIGPQPFLIERDNIETGIHEAITYLKVGDRAKIIIPPYLAHGLLGDNGKIPPMATLVFDLRLLGVSE